MSVEKNNQLQPWIATQRVSIFLFVNKSSCSPSTFFTFSRMSMLSEPRRRQKWSLNPRGNLWSKGKFNTVGHQSVIFCQLNNIRACSIENLGSPYYCFVWSWFYFVKSEFSTSSYFINRFKGSFNNKWHFSPCTNHPSPCDICWHCHIRFIWIASNWIFLRNHEKSTKRHFKT